jgi:uncharacterized protein YggT (Ycf19 family)
MLYDLIIMLTYIKTLIFVILILVFKISFNNFPPSYAFKNFKYLMYVLSKEKFIQNSRSN